MSVREIWQLLRALVITISPILKEFTSYDRKFGLPGVLAVDHEGTLLSLKLVRNEVLYLVLGCNATRKQASQAFAIGAEAAEKNVKALQSTQTAIKKVSFLPREESSSTTANLCYRCGRGKYDPRSCHFIDATCHTCGKKGHITPVCRSGKKPAGNRVSARTSKRPGLSSRSTRTKYVATSADEDDSPTQEFQQYTIGAKSATRPILVELDLNDKHVTMEVDTGAAVSLISERTYEKLFPGEEPKPSAIVLKTYTDEHMTVAGELSVQVRYREQCVPLSLVVVAGNRPSLFGSNWLEHLQLDWRTIRTVTCSETATTSLKKATHENVFKDELGTVHSHQAKLHVRPDTIPKFCEARSIPFTIWEAIELELDHLEATGIIQKVTHSDWAAPIVPVPKKVFAFAATTKSP